MRAAQIDRLPVWLNQVAAFIILGGLAGYVAWVWMAPRVVGRGQWSVTLPGGPLTLLQIVIGIVDLGFCAMAMYMLVPDTPHIDFVTVAVIFVSATLLGFASHSPGGLGVFDAAMLVGLWQFDKARTAGRHAAVSRALLHHAVRAVASDARRARNRARRSQSRRSCRRTVTSCCRAAASDVIAGSLDEADQTRSVVREERRA